MIRRPPIGALAPCFSLVWACGGPGGSQLPAPVCEHMLPTGCMHLVFRLTGGRLRTLDPRGGAQAQEVGTAVVAGVRAGFYVRERSMPVCSVGAVLRPGVARLLFGASAADLSGTHTPLDGFWGSAAGRMRDRLMRVDDCQSRLAVLESMLLARLGHVDRSPQAITQTIAVMPSLPSIEAAVRHSGLSHRSFIVHFRDAVGLAPKRYLRILRFQAVLHAIRRDGGRALALHAAEAGFSDQAHFSRDFLEFSGVTPREYLRRFPVEANHLPASPPAPALGQDSSRRVRQQAG